MKFEEAQMSLVASKSNEPTFDPSLPKFSQYLIEPEDLQDELHNYSQSTLIFDLREKSDFDKEHIRGAENMPCGVVNVTRIDFSNVRLVVFYNNGSFPEDKDFESNFSDDKPVMLLSGGIPAFRKLEGSSKFLVRKKQAPLPLISYSASLPERRRKKGCRPLAPLQPKDPKRQCIQGITRDDQSIYNATMSCILSWLFLGNARDSMNEKLLQETGITHIINATTDHLNCFESNIKYMRVPVQDLVSADLGPYFEAAIKFIDDARLSGGKVLVHCMAGVSRSASLVIAYLVIHSGLSVIDASSLANYMRAVVGPSFHFLGQVERFRLKQKETPICTEGSECPVRKRIMEKWHAFQTCNLPAESSHCGVARYVCSCVTQES